MSTDFFDLIVSNIQAETSDSVSVSFAVSEAQQAQFQYLAGQYLTLKFNINGNEVRRAYSMSSSPLEKDLTVTVKRVNKGIVSNHIADKLRVGDKIAVMPPQGRFVAAMDVTNRKHYYMIAAGSGITPIISMIKTIMEQEPQSIVSLLYSSRNEETIIFKTMLDTLQTRYANQLYVDYILSQPRREKSSGFMGMFQKGTLNWSGKVGRISRTELEKWTTQQTPVHKQREYYICGPEAMMTTAEQFLQAEGIDKKNIYIEHFTPAAAEKAQNLQGAKVSVQLRGETITFSASEGKTILDSLIELKKDAPYSCTSGACSTCMAKVTKGSVKMDSCYALDDDEVAAGYILTCQAHPVSAEVEITYEM